MYYSMAVDNSNTGKIIRQLATSGNISLLRKMRSVESIGDINGGETEENPKDPKYQKMAEEVVYQHGGLKKEDTKDITVTKVLAQNTGVRIKQVFQIVLNNGKIIQCRAEINQPFELQGKRKISYVCEEVAATTRTTTTTTTMSTTTKMSTSEPTSTELPESSYEWPENQLNHAGDTMKYPAVMKRLGAPKVDQVVVHHSSYSTGETVGGLSVLFSVLCIVDLFGVFPVVALPKSVIACGIYGIPLVLAVFALQLYTAVLLGRCWILAKQIAPAIREKNRYPYAAVAELAFGKHARRLVTFLIDATVFSAGVPNFIVASQSMQLFWWKITDGSVGVSYCVWMLLIGLLLCPVMWLGSPKDMKPLALTSVGIVTTVAICTWTCILLDDQSPPSAGLMTYQPRIRDLIVAYGIIAFQFDIHPMLLTIQVDMKDSRKINRAVLSGFAFTGALFAVTSALAAYRYGTHVESNILQGIPPSVPLFVVALLVTLQLCLSSAVGNSALFQHIEDLLKIPRDFCVQRCLIRSGIVALAVFLGETVPRFDVVMGLVGSTLTGPLMFIFPPLFFVKLCHTKSNLEKYDLSNKQDGGHKNGDAFPLILRNALDTKYKTFVHSYEEISKGMEQYRVKWYDLFLAVVVMAMGVGATVVSTYSSWSDAVNSATFSAPCLYNATAAARSFLEVIRKT